MAPISRIKGGGRFLLRIPGGGGVSQEGGRVSAGNFLLGGAGYFFSGPDCPLGLPGLRNALGFCLGGGGLVGISVQLMTLLSTTIKYCQRQLETSGTSGGQFASDVILVIRMITCNFVVLENKFSEDYNYNYMF